MNGFGSGLEHEGESSVSDEMIKWLERVRTVTLSDLSHGHSVDVLFRNTTEELGEVAKALSVENGEKEKEIKESSKIESVDLTICALSLFFAKGGTVEELLAIGKIKLPKWEERVRKHIKRKAAYDQPSSL